MGQLNAICHLEMSINLFSNDQNTWIQETAQNWIQNRTSTDVTVTFVDEENKLSNFECHKLIISVIIGKEYSLSLLHDVDNIIFADIEAVQFKKFLETLVMNNKVEVKKEKELDAPMNKELLDFDNSKKSNTVAKKSKKR